MEKTIMTETEKKLLIDVFGEEKRFEEGYLFSYQRDALEQLKAGEDYLSSRYPEYDFQLESLDPANKFRPWAELRIRAEDSPSCYVRIIPQGGGRKFVCEDNFYGYISMELIEPSARIDPLWMLQAPDINSVLNLAAYEKLYQKSILLRRSGRAFSSQVFR